MGRAVVVGALILLLVALPIAAFWPCLDCPECDLDEPCFRCDGRDFLTPFARAFGRPTHPAVRDLLQDGPDPEARLRDLGGADLLAWDGKAEAFELESVAPLPDRMLLVGLGADDFGTRGGSPCRILLFSQDGELRDRMDAWLETPTRQSLGFLPEFRGICLGISENARSKVPRSPNLVLRRANGEESRRPLPSAGEVDDLHVVGREGRLVIEDR